METILIMNNWYEKGDCNQKTILFFHHGEKFRGKSVMYGKDQERLCARTVPASLCVWRDVFFDFIVRLIRKSKSK